MIVIITGVAGAFGGKFTKHIAAHCAAAVACQKLGRAVCLPMDIETDMGISGETRHPMKVMQHQPPFNIDQTCCTFCSPIVAY